VTAMPKRNWKFSRNRNIIANPTLRFTVKRNDNEEKEMQSDDIQILDINEKLTDAIEYHVVEIEYDNTIRPSIVTIECEILDKDKKDAFVTKHTITIICPSLEDCGISV